MIRFHFQCIIFLFLLMVLAVNSLCFSSDYFIENQTREGYAWNSLNSDIVTADWNGTNNASKSIISDQFNTSPKLGYRSEHEQHWDNPEPIQKVSSYQPCDISDEISPYGSTRKRSCFVRGGCSELSLYKKSFLRFHSKDTALNYSVVLAIGAVFANTNIDQSFQNSYQDHTRSSGTDDVAKFFKVFGEGQYFIPTTIIIGLTYRCMEQSRWISDRPVCGRIGTFSSRAGRAYLVGAPALLLGQVLTGAGRPSSPNATSKWKPFEHSNGISGHAYIGAIPFITAAQMTDNCFLKTGFLGLSMMTGWSRINDNAHYFSQVMLGWYLAYLSCYSVGRIDGANIHGKGLTIFPILDDKNSGISVRYEY